MITNKIYNEDCLQTMANMPNNFVDLTVTSPPYDNLRDYKGYTFDFKSIAKELYRITKQGGIVVWVVNDSTVNRSESGTSLKQALYFKEIGFNLHDTMIWEKDTFSFPDQTRYRQCFEYMFVFCKDKLKTFNPINDRINKYSGHKVHGTSRKKDGTTFRKSNCGTITEKIGRRFNIWHTPNAKSNKFGHPAIFPEKLVQDHILSWSNEGDLVYDPFMGSGTTAKMARLLGRNYIGSEISEEYCKICEQRLSQSILF